MKANGVHRANAKKIYFILFVVLFFLGKFGFAQSQLPVFNTFTAASSENKINLQWDLSTLKNVSSIFVERSSDTQGFVAIAEIWVTADSPGTQFRYRDSKPVAGATYRLKLVSANGAVIYSKTASATETAIPQ
ncbi:MAG: hypothetical protein H7Y27_14090 [Gemmatimonadaceae bacterium]|nr:hypothetical protein [Chitinophagaceae bacterium]